MPNSTIAAAHSTLLVAAGILLCAVPRASAQSANTDSRDNTASKYNAIDMAGSKDQKKPKPKPEATGLDYKDLMPKGFNLALPGPSETIDQEAGGLRRALADLGIGYIGIHTFSTAYNVLPDVARSYKGQQQYNGQTFSYANYTLLGLTYDLSRYGIPDGQIFVAGQLSRVSWDPLGPDKLLLTQASYYQTFLDKRLELKFGYLANTWQYLNHYVGGALSTSVFGPSATVPILGGSSQNGAPAPGVDLKWNVDRNWYVQGGVQRSLNPDGILTEALYNPSGVAWTTPNAGALYLGEVGYQQAAAAGVNQTWVRTGGGYNTSKFKSYVDPGARVDYNYYLYFAADRQVWQIDPATSPGRGIYVGGSAMYAPPYANAISEYYEARLYARGLFDSRPYDLISLVYTDTVWGSDAINLSASAGNMVHRDSKAITLSYSARVMHGVNASIGVSYVNHPTSIAYQANTGSALNVLGSLNLFF